MKLNGNYCFIFIFPLAVIPFSIQMKELISRQLLKAWGLRLVCLLLMRIAFGNRLEDMPQIKGCRCNLVLIRNRNTRINYFWLKIRICSASLYVWCTQFRIKSLNKLNFCINNTSNLIHKKNIKCACIDDV